MKIGLGFDKYPKKYDCIAIFKNIDGIEGEYLIQKKEDRTNLYEITLYECNTSKEEFIRVFNKESELYGKDTYLHFLSQKKEILTSNFISNTNIVEIIENEFGTLNIKINGYLEISDKGFYKIAKTRLTKDFKKLGLWKTLPPNEVQGWLEVALRFGNKTIDISNKVVSINSNGMDTKEKFYCAIGEAINGAGGYFGRNRDALVDCCRGNFGIKGSFTLNWVNHKIYKEKFPDYFEELIQILSEHKNIINLK